MNVASHELGDAHVVRVDGEFSGRGRDDVGARLRDARREHVLVSVLLGCDDGIHRLCQVILGAHVADGVADELGKHLEGCNGLPFCTAEITSAAWTPNSQQTFGF